MRLLFRNFLILTFAALYLAGCSQGLTPQAATPILPDHTPTFTAAPSPTALPATPTAPPPTAVPPQKTHYKLSVVLDYWQHTAEVEEEIIYNNATGQTLETLPLMVDAARYPGTLAIQSITWGDGQAIQVPPISDGDRLDLALPAPLPATESIRLQVRYRLNLPSPTPDPSIRPIPFGYTSLQTNLVDWYPYVPPYQEGKGWLAHPAGYYGEHLAYEMASFAVGLKLTGAGTEQVGKLIVAASAPAEIDGEWRRYAVESARNFAISVSPLYQVQTEQVGAVKVSSYFFPAHKLAGQAVLKTSAQALALYGGLFGPYPHPELAVVEADFLDGMEYDGLYFLSNGFYNLYGGTPGEYLVAIAAHETAHQWWYGLVGNDQALEPWLDEALSTYCERLYYEHVAPQALQWWWDYRVRYYNPAGWVDTSIYNPDGSLQPYRAYRDAVYLNGALFLEDLRQAMGDEAFFGFLKDYAQQFAGKIATQEDFFNVLKKHVQADLSPLISKYFRP